MRESRFFSFIIFLTSLVVLALCCASQAIFAKGQAASSCILSSSSRTWTTQPRPTQGQGDDNSAQVTTFTGNIVKSGSNIVLAASDNQTTYQLDDRQKVQNFLGKKVAVTGSLDPSSGTIRIGAVDPIRSP